MKVHKKKGDVMSPSRWRSFQKQEEARRPVITSQKIVCAFCKCLVDSVVVYRIRTKQYHKVCFTIVYERAKENGTWNPPVVIAAGQFAASIDRASSSIKTADGSVHIAAKTGTTRDGRTVNRGM